MYKHFTYTVIRISNRYNLSGKISHKKSTIIFAIVPQLSTCLKFEAIRGDQTDKRFAFKQRDITRPVHVLLFGKWHTIIISFI